MRKYLINQIYEELAHRPWLTAKELDYKLERPYGSSSTAINRSGTSLTNLRRDVIKSEWIKKQ